LIKGAMPADGMSAAAEKAGFSATPVGSSSIKLHPLRLV
jgi:hypothetical protein